MIYTVGDSHAWHAWLKIPGVITKTIGPMTMYGVGRDHPIVTQDIPKNDTVIFCWGEIDCRCHVANHPPFEECIDKLAESYLKTIELNVVGKERDKCLLFNVVPPPRRASALGENPAYPFRGTDDERLSFVKRLNLRLSESGFIFIDVYDKYADKDGFLRMDMSDGHVHIADPKPLEEWLHAHA